MITELTKKQQKGIKEWQEYCLKIGRDTSPINKELIETSWNKFYQKMGFKQPKYWYCQSPLQAMIIINLWPEITKIFNVTDSGDNIWDNIRANIKKTEFKWIYTYSWCQHDINWIGYCIYYEKYGLLPNDENFEIMNIWMDLAKSCGWCFNFENIVFVCERPSKLNLNKDGQLHKDGGMALEYSDGYGFHCLNGVRVPEYLAMTKENDLSIEFFKKEKNADIKAEFIRKFGIQRMSDMGNVVDSHKNYDEEWWTKSEYELIDMASIFESVNYAPYLKMKNQTIDGVFHMEGVHPNCRTIEQALEFRCGGKVKIVGIS